MVILTTVILCKPTVGQFNISFAHCYTINWQLGLLESSGEETILHKNMVGAISCLFAYQADRQMTELQSSDC